MSEIVEFYDENSFCPLDCVEEVLDNHNWIYSRDNPNEILVEVAGKTAHYHLLFLWQKDVSALQLCCQYDLKVLEKNFMHAASAIMSMNSTLWLGHFELGHDACTPTFRQTSLMRDENEKSVYEHIEDLVEICLTQCERFHPVFDLLTVEQDIDTDLMSLAMMETEGES